MKIINETIQLSATDLSDHIACTHLTYLDISVAKGIMSPPDYRDPMLAVLQERGQEFERTFLEQFLAEGLRISMPGMTTNESGTARTLAAMQEGVDVIYQADLANGLWRGRADFLQKVDKSSTLGDWSYEVLDSKLAKQTRAGTILQLCLYSEALAILQRDMPEYMHVITPQQGFTKQTFRVNDFLAYYRFVRNRLLQTITDFDGTVPTYPTPCAHCEICNWWQQCGERRRTDDHLSLVAGLSNAHATEIKRWGIETLEQFAQVPLPLPYQPSRGATDTYVRLREQARVQLIARETGQVVYEYLDIVEGRGFFKLPAPSEGDIFFDLEGDPFVGTQGLEYLFGWVVNMTSGEYHYRWSFTPDQERRTFEQFMDMVMERLAQYPDMHIYHFSPYEPSALKRLMGKYASKEDEMDRLLRAGVLVDLYSVARQAIRAGIETYSLKELEQLHAFEREVELRFAAAQLRMMEGFIERKSIDDVPEATLAAVQGYNREDCLSTQKLRDWLELLRQKLLQNGENIRRPEAKEGTANEAITEHQQRIKPLHDALMQDLPADVAERTPEQQARWLLAHMLDWYRREKKATWWEYYRLCELSDSELLEEKSAISGLHFSGQRQPDKKSTIDRYTFPPQECDIRNGDELKAGDGESFGKVTAIDTVAGMVAIRKGPKIADIHPTSVFKHTNVSDTAKEEAIIRIAAQVVNHGINVEGKYRAGRDLLLNLVPRTIAGFNSQEEPQRKAVEWVLNLKQGVLPIQGPPGTGKSHTAADMILALVQAGKKVGITALSHKVIIGLMQKVNKAATEKHIHVRCMRKITDPSDNPDPFILEEKDYSKVAAAIRNGAVHILGGTPWLWAREDMASLVDVLFVDEAGQLSLIDTVAVSQAASNLVLLGDPQQLKQPQQGVHPEGTEVSALEHILQKHQTIPAERGVFLNTSWRLHPKICSFVSELFYESRLSSKPACAYQLIDGNTKWLDAGLWFEAVHHVGNQSSSAEEVTEVVKIISNLLKGDIFYTDDNQNRRLLTTNDIKVITPYNAQVSLLAAALPAGIQVGTVDKFQGQEAPVVIFSMATSSPEDAPRGMEFLYSLNRLNVAVSRAKATFIMVANPNLFEPNCKSVGQMRLANAFCRFLEMSNNIMGQ